MGKRPSLQVGVTHYHIPPNHRQTEIGVHLTNEKQSLGDLVHKYEAEHNPLVAVSDSDMVRFLADSNEMTQTELAQRSGIAESTISAILAGKRKLSRRHIAALSRVFRVSPAVFFPEAEEMTHERVATVLSRRSGLDLSRDLLVSLASAFACDPDRACWRDFQELVAANRPGMPTDLMASRMNSCANRTRESVVGGPLH